MGDKTLPLLRGRTSGKGVRVVCRMGRQIGGGGMGRMFTTTSPGGLTSCLRRLPNGTAGRGRILRCFLRRRKPISRGRLFSLFKVASSAVGKLVRGKLLNRESIRVCQGPFKSHRFREARPLFLASKREGTVVPVLGSVRGGQRRAFLLCKMAKDKGARICLRSVRQILRGNGRTVILIPRVSLAPRVIGHFGNEFNGRITMVRDNLSTKRGCSR